MQVRQGFAALPVKLRFPSFGHVSQFLIAFFRLQILPVDFYLRSERFQSDYERLVLN